MWDIQKAHEDEGKRDGYPPPRSRKTSMNLFRAFDIVRLKQMHKEISPSKSGGIA